MKLITLTIAVILAYRVSQPYRDEVAKIRAGDAMRRREDTLASEEACLDLNLLLALEEIEIEEREERERKMREDIARFNQLTAGMYLELRNDTRHAA